MDPQREVYEPQMPTVAEGAPAPTVYTSDQCGNCPGWKQQHARFPFGQCLPAMRALGAVMYTPDLSGCTLDPKIKEKAGQQ